MLHIRPRCPALLFPDDGFNRLISWMPSPSSKVFPDISFHMDYSTSCVCVYVCAYSSVVGAVWILFFSPFSSSSGRCRAESKNRHYPSNLQSLSLWKQDPPRLSSNYLPHLSIFMRHIYYVDTFPKATNLPAEREKERENERKRIYFLF